MYLEGQTYFVEVTFTQNNAISLQYQQNIYWWNVTLIMYYFHTRKSSHMFFNPDNTPTLSLRVLIKRVYMKCSNIIHCKLEIIWKLNGRYSSNLALFSCRSVLNSYPETLSAALTNFSGILSSFLVAFLTFPYDNTQYCPDCIIEYKDIEYVVFTL